MSAAAGCRSFDVFEEQAGETYPMLVLYPSEAAERVEKFGPYTLSVAMDGGVAPGSYPLVAISHGGGGSHLLYRALAAHLARNGFVVAMPEHPRNNRNNNELAGTAQILENRPRHIRRALDRVFADEALGAVLRPGMAAVIGHSLGGYTALALAGGEPWAFHWETPEREARPVPVERDERVRALVLLAPAAPWFHAPGSLRGVRVPILMLTGEKDDLEIPGPKTLPDGTTVVAPYGHGEIVKRGVDEAARVEHRVVEGAGHYSFLTPFPEAMIRVGFPPSQDPPGFDRVRFHEEMNEEVRRFLRGELG